MATARAQRGNSVARCCLAMLLPCCCHVVAMLLPCCCHAVAMLLPCYCHAIAMLWPGNAASRRGGSLAKANQPQPPRRGWSRAPAKRGGLARQSACSVALSPAGGGEQSRAASWPGRATSSATRAATPGRRTQSPDGKARLAELVGPATESREAHLARHGGKGVRSCPRCRWYLHGHRWMPSYGVGRGCSSSGRGAGPKNPSSVDIGAPCEMGRRLGVFFAQMRLPAPSSTDRRVPPRRVA